MDADFAADLLYDADGHCAGVHTFVMFLEARCNGAIFNLVPIDVTAFALGCFTRNLRQSSPRLL